MKKLRQQIGDMIAVPDSDNVHDQLQFQVSLSRYNDQVQPLLEAIDFTFFDSTQGPTTEELIAQQRELDAQRGYVIESGGYPRPAVISREVWCQSADCFYTSGLEYDDASHMIVHHTVSANSSSNWAAVMRAIWAFHTYPSSGSCSSCRGWGDIGYNYLIDRTGVIYEGHMNEDYLNLDVVGTHAGDANRGSMGTSLIGTFTSSSEYPVYDVPPAAMQNSLMELFAWKASQRDIDVYDSSHVPDADIYWGLPHIMGHRDVYGGLNTLCPGGNAHNLLPAIRDGVADRLNFVDGYNYVDDLSSDFSLSNSNWYESPRGCGHNLHAFYTFSTTNPAESTNWGDWTLRVPDHGRYRIEVHAPYCNTGEPETYGATYTIDHFAGSSTVVANHQANIGLWMSLGEFNFFGGQNYNVHLSDLTTTDSGRGVWFDGLRFIKVGELPETITPLAPSNDSWHNQRTINFNWEVESVYPVVSTRLQVATNSSFSSPLLNQNWTGEKSSFAHTFGADYDQLYWRVTAVIDKNGAQVPLASPVRSLGIDTIPPTSEITGIFSFGSPQISFMVRWSGADNAAGVATYTIQFRLEGESTWQNLVTNSTALSAVYTPLLSAGAVDFRVIALDAAGNEQLPSAELFISSTEAIPLQHDIMMPSVTR